MSVKCGMRNSGSGIAVRGGAAARSAAGTTQHVRLGDVAEEVRENWSGPTADVPVVGLEHIEPDEIWLRKWEVNPDENTFSKAFRKGQLLFGRRRAYQKKLSLAPSDGICSGDITVIAAKSDKVVPSLLPFLLRTDKFFDYAIQGSAGSLSPRVKWAHLAKYEFDLPPMDEQKKLAELLWAANDLKESYKKAITATDEMLKAKFREMFGDAGDGEDFNAETQRRREVDGGSVSHGDAEARSKWPMVKLGEVFETCSGGTPLTKHKEYYDGGTIPWMTSSEVSQGIITTIEGRITELGLEKSAAKLVPENSVVVAMYGATAGKVGLLKVKTATNQAVCAILPNSKVLPEYLLFTLSAKQDYMVSNAKGGAQPNISQAFIRNIFIPLPPLSLQREFVAIADKAESAKTNLKKSIAAIDQVMKGLINQ